MQFKHPEFLYTLFALIIPILIHLFQLRRFQKVDFTNVQFLKAVSIHTRKSSQLKKWLTLLTRLLILAGIIIAFAQPFLASETAVNTKKETVIYLDNSFSMQAKGAKGPLLQRAIQELLSNLPEEDVISVFTNTETFRNVTKKDIQNDLLQLEYTSGQLPYKAAYLKAKGLLTTNAPSQINQRIVMVSDFQQKEDVFSLAEGASSKVDLVQLKPVSRQNISVDSLDLVKNQENQLMLRVTLSNTNSNAENSSVALYNEDKLLAKTSVSIPKNGTKTTEFRIEENTKINGRITIEDPSLTFDNSRYFTINTPEKIKVLAINQSNDAFIKNIFTEDEFVLISTPLEMLNYNDISTSNFIIINELLQIPVSLTNALRAFTNEGGSVCFIPAAEGNLTSYQQFLTRFSSKTLLSYTEQEKKITAIAIEHPLYKGVFDKKVTNFQYPKVNSHFKTTATEAILSYQDNTPFLFKTANLYVFTAALNKENSNFKNSPIIVPSFYNMGKQSLQLSNISYTIGKANSYDVPVSLGQDGILTLSSSEESVIPLQQSFSTKVRITTDENPSKAGIYSLKDKEKLIQDVSYNYDTTESNLQYYNISSNENYAVTDSIVSFFDKVKEEDSINELWKWFVIFALCFICIEILFLKYLP